MKKLILIPFLLCSCAKEEASCPVDVSAVEVDADTSDAVDVSEDVSSVAVASDATSAD